MKNNHLVLLTHCCIHYNIEMSFIEALEENGMIRITQVNDDKYLHHDDLREIEKMIQFHYDLGINIEGIEVITRMMAQINKLQQKLHATQHKLKVLEREFLFSDML